MFSHHGGGLAQTHPAASANEAAAPSPWAPLRTPLFRGFWLAGLLSNIGSLAQDTTAAWLMTGISGAPVMVALLQATGSLAVFIFALPAGALADVLDRRRLMLWAQGWMLLAALLLAMYTWTGALSPWLLLALAFAGAAGSALSTPSAQTVLGDLLPHPEIPRAIVLGSMSLNLARAVGPLAAGYLIGRAGPWAPFLLNAFSFTGMLFFLSRWRHAPPEQLLPAERIFGAMAAGLRYARYSPPLQAALARGAVFAACASALWSLLPLLVRKELGLGATGYGAVMACVGVGALLGARLLPWARARCNTDWLVAGMSVCLAAVAVALAHVRNVPLLGLLMLGTGAAWLMVFSTLAVSAGSAAPVWVKGRALSVYLLVSQGSIFLGSLLWGTLATRYGLHVAFTIAGLGLGVGALTRFLYPLAPGERVNLTPSGTRPAPETARAPELERGPVLITVEYRIDPDRSESFAQAMREVRLERLREGALTWSLFEDLADPGRRVEVYLVESWVEHLREHERVTVSDREAEQRVQAFHLGDRPPVVSHFAAEPVTGPERVERR